ncbi:MAG TPA: hypothetical protein VHG91_13420 [Longimicrobium sp.]|nr:hypothetical protein [Longimicrobium sp.]
MSWFRRGSAPGGWTWPYTPDARDRVVPVGDVPRVNEGAPLPVVVASEFRLSLVYLMQERPLDQDGSRMRIVSADTGDLLFAAVEFRHAHAHLFGPPNDETILAHPLAGRGIHPNGAFAVEGSSWIRALERMNSVHEQHSPWRFRGLTHYLFTFIDSTFECAAEDFTVSVHHGSLRDVVAEVAGRLE